MRVKNKNFFSIITNENGLTLVELLAATFIFLVVVIPLSGIYLSGVKTYTKTVTLSQLHSELDFVIADIMKKTQDASYFDLEDEAQTEDEDRQIFSSSFGLPNKAALYRTLAVYSIQVGSKEVKIDPGDPSKTEIQPNSTVIHDVYQFQLDGDNTPFNYNHANYLVYGLFQLDTTESTPNYKKLNLYLLIAPYSEHPLLVDGKPTSFHNLTDISNAISQGNPYTRMVKTQITVNNIRQG